MISQYLDSYTSYSVTTVGVLLVIWIALECWARAPRESVSS